MLIDTPPSGETLLPCLYVLLTDTERRVTLPSCHRSVARAARQERWQEQSRDLCSGMYHVSRRAIHAWDPYTVKGNVCMSMRVCPADGEPAKCEEQRDGTLRELIVAQSLDDT
jgi:hypothetical protein